MPWTKPHPMTECPHHITMPGLTLLIQGLGSANERRRYKVKPPLISWPKFRISPVSANENNMIHTLSLFILFIKGIEYNVKSWLSVAQKHKLMQSFIFSLGWVCKENLLSSTGIFLVLQLIRFHENSKVKPNTRDSLRRTQIFVCDGVSFHEFRCCVKMSKVM